MFKAVIAGYSRSPFTMARKGELIDVKPVNLPVSYTHLRAHET